jgi:hypothetical protein
LHRAHRSRWPSQEAAGVAKGGHGGDGFCLRLLTSNFSKNQKQKQRFFVFVFFGFQHLSFVLGFGESHLVI